jgi:hypothetical protein
LDDPSSRLAKLQTELQDLRHARGAPAAVEEVSPAEDAPALAPLESPALVAALYGDDAALAESPYAGRIQELRDELAAFREIARERARAIVRDASRPRAAPEIKSERRAAVASEVPSFRRELESLLPQKRIVQSQLPAARKVSSTLPPAQREIWSVLPEARRALASQLPAARSKLLSVQPGASRASAVLGPRQEASGDGPDEREGEDAETDLVSRSR